MKTRLSLAVALAAAAAMILSGCSLLGQLTGGGDDVFSLKVGDCISQSTGDGEVSSVPKVDCSEPHDDEVYFDFSLPDGEFPGENAMYELADQGCYDAFEPFVGIAFEQSSLGFSYYVPTSRSWGQGDRLVSCLIYDPSGQVTGTLGGSKR